VPSKAQIIGAIQTYVDALNNLELRASLGDPNNGPIWIRGESVATGQAYKVPGFTDAILHGVATATSIYGEDFQRAYSAGRVIEEDGVYTPVLTINIPTGLNGDYEILWWAVVDSPTGTVGQVRLYNATDLSVMGAYIEHPLTTTERKPVHGAADLELTGTAKTVRLQHRDKTGTGTHGIQDIRMTIKRVS